MKNDETRLEEILRRRHQPAGEPGPSCADAELLAAYAEGGLSGEARTRFENHLASCGHCQAAVVRLVRLAPAESAARPPAEPARRPASAAGFRWSWAIPALAGVVLVGSFAYYQRSHISQTTQDAQPAAQRSVPPAARDESLPAEADHGVAPPASADKRATPPVSPAGAPAAEARGGVEEKGAGTGAKLEQRAADSAGKRKTADAEGASPLGKMTGARPSDTAAAPAESAEPSLRKDSRAVAPAAPKPAPPPASPAMHDRFAAAETRAAANAPRPLTDTVNTNRQAPQSNVLPGVQAEQSRAGGPRNQANQAQMAQNQTVEVQAGQAKPSAGAGNEVTLARRERSLEKEQSEETAKLGAALSTHAPAQAAPKKAAAEMGFAPSPAPRGKVLNAGNRAFGVSGVQLMMKPDRAAGWEAAELPATGRVLDFTIAGKSLWVLMSGGRVIHSPDLGTTWRAPVSTGLPDAASILFSSAASGEVRGPSGRRVTQDGGRTWTEPEN